MIAGAMTNAPKLQEEMVRNSNVLEHLDTKPVIYGVSES